MDSSKKNKLWALLFEFLTIFVSVTAAFGFTRWNDNIKDRSSEKKILLEIKNGLEQDILDVQANIRYHQEAIYNIQLLQSYLFQDVTDKNLTSTQKNRALQDSLGIIFHQIFAPVIVEQNIAGYETLKSKGLEVLQDDKLRLDIISLYEYDYQIIQKSEETSFGGNFDLLYFSDFNRIMSKLYHLTANNQFVLKDVNVLPENEKNELSLLLNKIATKRINSISIYNDLLKKIQFLDRELKSYLQ